MTHTMTIGKDFYCSAGAYVKPDGDCCFSNGSQLGMAFGKCRKNKCPYYHRKHPTPEQFKEEYGFDVPDDMPVWLFYKILGEEGYTWSITDYQSAKLYNEQKKHPVVCACSPFPKPDDTWRPE